MKRRSGIFLKVIFLAALLSLFPLVIIPAQAPEMDVTATARLDTETTGIITVTYPIPEGFHQTLSADYFTFVVIGPEGITTGQVGYPDGKTVSGEKTFYGQTVLTAPFTLKKALTKDIPLVVEARWQLCSDEGTCYRPQTVNINVPLSPFDGTGAVSPETGGYPLILLYLLFAFVGGLILNVMPCVLPVLSIKALSLVRQGGNDRKELLSGSLAYAGGILVSFAVMAALVVLLKASGKALGWGFQFQNIPYVVFLTVLTFLFALSLFGVFEVMPLRAAGEGSVRAQKQGGLTGSFLTGLLAVLLATPCTAPFLGAAMGFAFTQPPPVVFLLFLATGLGLAFPFLILGFQPKLFKLIPKPGPWMDLFKKLMGFALAATSLYLLGVLYKQTGSGVISILWFLLTAAVAAWIWGDGVRPDRSRPRRIISALIALILLTTGGLFFLKSLHRIDPAATAQADRTDQIKPFDEAELARLRADGQTVFLLFTADWCLTCKTNEKTVLSTKTVEALFAANRVIVMKGDFTHENPAILSFLQKHDRAGVPFYQLYRPGEEPVDFPEILTTGMIKQALDR